MTKVVNDSKAVTPMFARSVARAMMVKITKYRAPHAILWHNGEFVIRRVTPAHRIDFPEWWNDSFRYILVGIYDRRAILEDVADDILAAYAGEYASPRNKKQPSAA